MKRAKPTTASRHVTTLTADPGFAKFGWAVVRRGNGVDTVLDMGVVTTAPPKTKGMLKSDVSFARLRETSERLWAIADQYSIDAVAFESLSLPRQASKQNAVSIGHPYGILAMLATALELPAVQTTPQKVKKALCPEIKKPTKQEVEAALHAEFDEHPAVQRFREAYPLGDHNHAFDSLAVYVAARNTDIMRALRRGA